MIKNINNNNKILGLDAVWQPVNGTKHKFYVYSGKSTPFRPRFYNTVAYSYS